MAPLTSRAHPLITSLSCATLHPTDPSCLRTYVSFWARSFPRIGRTLLLFYSVLMLPRFRALYHAPVQLVGRLLARALRVSAFATGARGLARYVSAPRGMREADLAREVGVPPWKLRTLRDQSRSWSRDGLAAAINAVAQADADIKGAAHDPAYTLERLVLTIAALREGR